MVRDGKVEEVSAFVKNRKGIEGAQEVLRSESETAVDALGILPDSQARTYLSLLALKLSERDV